MAEQFKLRRGTASQMASFTGVQDEFTYETDTGDAVVHDGATAGGKFRHMAFWRHRNQVGRYATAGGTADALTLTLTPPLLARAVGTSVAFKAAVNNTGAATLDVDGTGAAAIKKARKGALADLESDDLVADAVYRVTWTGSVWLLEGGVGGGAAALEAVERKDVSSVAEVDFTTGLTSDGDSYLLDVALWRPATDGQSLQARLRLGGAWVTSGYRYAVDGRDAAGNPLTQSSRTGGAARLTALGGSNTTSPVRFSDMAIEIPRPAEAGAEPILRYAGTSNRGSTVDGAWNVGFAAVGTNGPVEGIRLFTTSGNLARLVATLYRRPVS